MAATRALLDAASNASADWLVRTSWQAGVLIAGVFAIQLLLGHKRLPPKWAYALWMLVVVRLLMPVVPSSPWSLFNLKLPHPADTDVKAAGVVASATLDRPVTTPVAEGPRVTVGIIDGPERRVTSSVVARRDLAPARVTPAPTRSAFSLRRLVVLAWLIGSAFAVLRVLVGTFTLRRRLRYADEPGDETLELLERCRREMGNVSIPRVLVSRTVNAPALLGFSRPVLLLSPSLLADLSREELRFVLLHELAHLRRRDPLANLLLVLASAVHWFNPLVRFALARCRAERELACDEMVMSCVDRFPATATTNAPASAYGQAVLRVAEALRPSARRVPVAAVGMIHTRSQLRRRIAMIATYTPRAVRRSGRFPRVVLPTLLVLLIASCALTDGATKPATKPAPEPSAKADDKAPVSPLVSARAPAPTAANDVGVSAEDPRMQSVLERKVPKLEFEGQPFSDVMDFLRETSGMNLVVDWRTLEAAGVDRNAPITQHVRDVSLAKALQIVLDDAGGGATKLGYTIDGNILKVSTQEEISKNTITRVYDIRDLLVEIPDFDNPRHTTAAPPQSRPADPAARRADHIKRISDLIQETVEPDSWRENGGTVGAMRELDGQLIVTQTEENHRELARLLEQLREPRSLQVSVEARFVTLDPMKLDESLRQKLAPSFEAAGGKPGVSFLTDDDVQALIRAGQQGKESEIVTAPRLTLFNGQRAYVQVTTQRAFVSGFRRETRAGETRWEPETSVVEAGIDLDVSATASADRKNVTLTLRPELTRLVGMMTKPFDGPPDAPKDLTVQVPQITAQRLQTSASIPDRQTLLLGGVVADVDASGQPSTRPTGSLYILVKPTLIVQREVAPR